MNGIAVGIIGLLIMVCLILLGVHIGIVFIVIGCVGYAICVNPAAAFGLIRTCIYSTAANYSYSVIPLFILMGELCFVAGVSQQLYSTSAKWLSWLPGGLAVANIGACAVFGAICGSLAATTATMGTVAIPEMRKHGYDDTLSCGSIAAGGSLGILIPPSTSLIVFGIAAEASIGKLFLAGILPGIICAVFMIATVVIWVKKRPEMAPKEAPCSMRERLASLKNLIGVIVVFGVTLGGMAIGIFTINEAAGIGAFMACLLMIFNRTFTWKNLKRAFLNTIKTSAMVYLLLFGSSVMVPFIAKTGIPNALSSGIISMGMSKYVFMALICLLYIGLGCIMDGISIILITTPIFLPIVESFGFSAIWFGVLLTLLCQIAAITPPVGLNCYVMAGVVKDVPLGKIFRSIVPFIFSLAASVAFVIIFPVVVTALPDLIMGV